MSWNIGPKQSAAVMFCLAAGLCGLASSLSAADVKKVQFTRDIRPILSDVCFTCHGPDENKRKASLRLDNKEGLLGKLESGDLGVVPGKSKESPLYQRLISTDPNERMPPPDSGKQLTPQQVELFRRWIDEGADYREHWSFTKLVRPELPKLRAKPESEVRHPSNPIDAFIRVKLDTLGLKPSGEADRESLIRRVTLDLTGLPPTPNEVDAYLKDSQPQAYERLVDRLLASPRYGEHIARYWLDAARYGDTHGLHLDNERSIWPYRDWVINAFNRNMPFDQFTIDQIAGDLVPKPTREQIVATGFARCNVTTGEGGSIDEEFYVRYNVERVETVATVFLGLTAGCSVCHDHKYDPITQKDFYSLFAFFNSLAENPMDGNALLPPPTLQLPNSEEKKEQQRLQSELAKVEQTANEKSAKLEYLDPLEQTEHKKINPQEYLWISGRENMSQTAEGLSTQTLEKLPQPLQTDEGDNLFVSVFLDPAKPPEAIMVQWYDGNWEHRAFWGADKFPWGESNTGGHLHLGELPEKGKWVRLEIPAGRVRLRNFAKVTGIAFSQFGGKVSWDKAGISSYVPQDGSGWASQRKWETALRKNYSLSQSIRPSIQKIAKLEPKKRTAQESRELRDYYLQYFHTATRDQFADLRKVIDGIRKQQVELERKITATLVMREMPARKDAFILIRGEYDHKGKKVTPAVPAVLPQIVPRQEGKLPDRLDLAKWLVSPENPLTSRVIVNRFWQQYFGNGIVETSEDFGSQGQFPTHPQLLDWLATEFIRTGWNVKELQRLIVTSAAYRQSSRMTPDALQRDPTNKFLARGSRFRLDAEVIRDAALFTSGLLAEHVGGKSVKPYQPEGLWEAIAYTDSNTAKFKQDHGTSLWRRSLYSFWKRTSPPPSLSTFDAPSREACVVRRARTNTPLQALALMNDVQFVEASRLFAERIMKEGGSTPTERATFAFRWVTSRKPKPQELEVLLAQYSQHLANYRQAPEAAKKLLETGEAPLDAHLDPIEQATWTMLANLLLNLNETVTRG
jgi:ribosomal protein L20